MRFALLTLLAGCQIGSGGLIGLDAPTIILDTASILIANGGGGGAGGSSGGANGSNGTNADDRDNYPFLGAGGSTPNAGDGGAGGTEENGAVMGADNSASGAGGGGGGGGIGTIVIAGTLDQRTGSQASPHVTTN